jgi:hypothetical protein
MREVADHAEFLPGGLEGWKLMLLFSEEHFRPSWL